MFNCMLYILAFASFVVMACSAACLFDFHPIKKVFRSFGRLSGVQKFSVLIIFTALAYIGGTKPGPSGIAPAAPSSAPMRPNRVVSHGVIDEVSSHSDMIDVVSTASTNLVAGMTNLLSITKFKLQDDLIEFGAQWKAGLLGTNDELGVFASTNLFFEGTNSCLLVAKTSIPEPCQSIEFSMPKIVLPEDWDESGVAFRLKRLLDSDGDGLLDYLEEQQYHTNPYNPDSDDDGINDGDEIRAGTLPNDNDTDDDGVLDGQELQYGSDPKSMYSKSGGVIDDYSAYVLRLDPEVADTDGDGINDIDEMRGRDINNTDPLKRDTDGDGLSDGDEVNRYNTNPRNVDTDGDGLSDYEEVVRFHSDPNRSDTDGDGISDYFEWIIGTDLNDSTTKSSLCTNISGPDYDNSSGSLFEFSHDFDVNVTYTGDDWDSDYAVFGIHPPNGGSTTANTLDFENSGPGTSYHNAFAMTFNNGMFRALRTGRYRFRINVDDWANINIDGTDITDDYYTDGVGVPGAYAEKLMVAGRDYPVSGSVTNVGGPAMLEFAKYVTFTPTDRAQCRAGFSKPFVMCKSHPDEPMSPEQHVFLRISARGGEFGGRLRFRGLGMTKLVGYPISGLDCDTLPSYLDVAANSTVNLLVSYRGNAPAASLDDVKLIAEFEEFQTGYTAVSTAAVSVVRAAMYADYDRDGDIDIVDKNAWAQGRKLRHWVNADDSDNSRVDGVADLIDFVPVRLDVTELLELLGNNAYDDYRFVIEGPAGAVNCVWTSLSPSAANSFQFESCLGAGPDFNSDVASARIATTNQEMSESFINHLRTGGGGVFLIEGKTSSYNPLVFACYRRVGGAVVARVRMPMQISAVEDMYWFHNLRHVCDDGSRYAHQNAIPGNLEVDEANTCLYFLHGFRVSLDGSREWFAEIFKRFWQAGAKVSFHGVTWASDQGVADYHRNVYNAFKTAPALANLMNYTLGEKVVMAHSLGNMVVSSAIQDHGLQVRKYLMCNSAVPCEAYYEEEDISIRASVLVHHDWEQYPTNSWASNWHKLFADNPSDGRRLLGWPGRFKRVLPCAVNFYSSGDEVLELCDDNDVGLWTGLGGLDPGHNSWHKQEIFKGCGGVGGTNWTGWSFRRDFFSNLISPEEAKNMNSEDLRTNTVFRIYPESFDKACINRDVANEHLARGVPALAGAAGSRHLMPGVIRTRNINLDSEEDGSESLGALRINGWPNNFRYGSRWLHSDIKDVPYFYNFNAYEKLIQTGGLR